MRVLRKVFGAICDIGERSKHCNNEPEKLYGHLSVITTKMINRLKMRLKPITHPNKHFLESFIDIEEEVSHLSDGLMV